MKGMPLPFEEFQGKAVLDFCSSSSSLCSTDCLPHIKYQHLIFGEQQEKWQPRIDNREDFCCYVQSTFSNIIEPRSVLEASRRPSPPNSSSTLSSSQGPTFTACGGSATSTDTAGTTTTSLAATAAVNVANSSNPSPVDVEKCGQPHFQGSHQLGMEDWESVLSVGGSGGGSSSPSQEQSILRLIMGDMEDPSLGLNKLLQSGVGIGSHPGTVEYNNAACFGMADQVFNFEAIANSSTCNDPSSMHANASSSSPDFLPVSPSLGRIGSILNQIPNQNTVGYPLAFNPSLFPQEQQAIEDEKPQIFNPLIINQGQTQFTQSPAMLLPLSYPQLQEQHSLHLFAPPPPKRLHSVSPIGGSLAPSQVSKVQYPDSRSEFFLQRQLPQLPTLQQNQQRSAGINSSGSALMMRQKLMGGEELGNGNNPQLQFQLQQAIVNTLIYAAEQIESNKTENAREILARLNHQLPVSLGKPPHRAALFFKEALEQLVQLIMNNPLGSSHINSSSYSLIFKIGAYKAFSEISPILQFANFTCNQALLEAFEGYDRIHIVDFDLGFGGQWASLMQELALRSGGGPSLKITAFASPSSHDELELSFTQDNLEFFAREINMPFELEILSLDSLSSGSWPVMALSRPQDKEILAVNLPIATFTNFPASMPMVLSFVKQLSPKIVVSLDRGCDQSDLPLGQHVRQAIQSYSLLLESLDAVNMNSDTLQKIERFLIQPAIEKVVMGRHRCLGRSQPWRNLFGQNGFTPLSFSNFAEAQADCLVQRTPVRGFHVEKKQSSLVLFWQRKELVSASAWRCC